MSLRFSVGFKGTTWTLKLPIKIGDHPIILGVKPISNGFLRVQVDIFFRGLKTMEGNDGRDKQKSPRAES